MTIESLIRAGRKHEASDIHIVVGLPPVFRVDGEMITASVEFEDCLSAAKAHNTPVKEIVAVAEAIYRRGSLS